MKTPFFSVCKLSFKKGRKGSSSLRLFVTWLLPWIKLYLGKITLDKTMIGTLIIFTQSTFIQDTKNTT